MPLKIAIVGFGVVGQGFAEILSDKGTELGKDHGLQWSVVAVSDTNKGAVCDEKGLNLQGLLTLVKETGSVEGYPTGEKGWDAIKTIRDSGADVIVEATYTNLETGEPATTHFMEALEQGKHLITTNKGPIALHHDKLVKAARDQGVELRFEGTVLSGTPSLNLAAGGLAGAGVTGFRGILNGTTNYILGQMEAGTPYADALRTAQKLGYAEADPTADVEGWDAVAKVVILCAAVLGHQIKVEDVQRSGITALTIEDIEKAAAEKARWKLIGRAQWEKGRIAASVRPEKVPETDALCGVGGVNNALTFSTGLLGDVTIVGPGAGRKETGFSLLNDLLAIHEKRRVQS